MLAFPWEMAGIVLFCLGLPGVVLWDIIDSTRGHPPRDWRSRRPPQ